MMLCAVIHLWDGIVLSRSRSATTFALTAFLGRAPLLRAIAGA